MQRGMTGIVATIRNSGQPIPEFLPAAADTDTKTSAWPDDSQVGAAPFAQVFQSLLSQPVQPPSGHVLLKLLVPDLGVELSKPGAEGSQLLAGQLSYGAFNV